MTIEAVTEWHRRAKPTPDARSFDVQLGCHIEEFKEMLEALAFGGISAVQVAELHAKLDALATLLKAGHVRAHITNRKELLDALADQVVTSAGVAYRAGMSLSEAVRRVNESNWSKYEDGYPVFDRNGKIGKGPNYVPPNLDGLY